MLDVLTVPFVDARPEDLELRLGLPAQPALAVKHLHWPGHTVQLRLLGSSHQVIVEGGASAFSETVACLRDGGELPETSTADGYRFASAVTYPGARFEAHVQRLMATLSNNPSALAGAFPGHPLAMTGVEFLNEAPGQFKWRTWHAYPQCGALVQTDSVLIEARR